MVKVVIFSGTTEGRMLSELLSLSEVKHVVCVASEYGEEVMRKSDYADVRCGRMDATKMSEMMTEMVSDGLTTVVDATHPYATEVTKNIKEAASLSGLEYIRVVRADEKAESVKVTYYDSLGECIRGLSIHKGNILLTTGSKELGTLKMTDASFIDRVYVRVLPSAESLELCERAGVDPTHIIAMHGPFSTMTNEAILRQYDIAHLVTKSSGHAGGFMEKVNAANNCGVWLHVISRPIIEEGITYKEAYEKITGTNAVSEIHVSLVGRGMGSPNNMTCEAKEAISRAEAVYGASRMLEDIDCCNKHAFYRSEDIIESLEANRYSQIAIIFSGDTGYNSGAGSVREGLLRWAEASGHKMTVETIPGISSVSYMAAKVGESYENAGLCSIHGKNTPAAIRELIKCIRSNKKVFVLLSGGNDVSAIAEAMMKEKIAGTITVGSNLSYENEAIVSMTLQEALDCHIEGLCVAFIRNSSVVRRRILPMRKDSEFIRSSVPMTKECVRNESIIRLGLSEGDVVYDIGGGTGSVGITVAGLDESLRVYSIECKPEAAELIKKNAASLSVSNIEVIEGMAPECLDTLEAPDAVFIGGSLGKMKDILAYLKSLGKGIRVVINAVSLETIAEVNSLVKEMAFEQTEIVQLAVSDVRSVGSYNMLSATNPVMIFSFVINDEV